jgi:hypothetical protein
MLLRDACSVLAYRRYVWGFCKTLGLALALTLAAGCASSGPTETARVGSGGLSSVSRCDLVASPGGAIRTPEELVAALRPGQTGCFDAGTYSSTEVDVSKPGVTLQSLPGKRATWDGRIVIAAAGVTIRSLNLDGTTGRLLSPPYDPQCQAVGGCTLPGLTITGAGAKIYRNDITNSRGICINAASYGGVTPDDFDIERNRIHDCKPADNHIHGIYVAEGANGVIKYNAIFDNGDRGIQLYPHARHETISYNTVDGNRTGLEFGGNGPNSASDNTVTNNIFSFPSSSADASSPGLGARFNVEAHWVGAVGSGNRVTGNCSYTNATGQFSGSPAHSGFSTDPGFSAQGNIVADPSYVDRAAKNFTLRHGSSCAGLGAPGDVVVP